MKALLASLYPFAFVSILITPLQVTAVDLCTSPDSDSDGDGWGWENDSSCLVDPVTAIQPPPACELESSDPDGDGWGWENDASCVVDVPTSPIPGNSIATATNIAVDAELANTLTSETEAHWYSIDIDDGETAFEFSVGSESFLSFVSTRLEDSSGTVQASVESFDQLAQSTALCLSPGRYFLSVSAYFDYDVSQASYRVSLKSTDLSCARPQYTIATNGSAKAFATINGGYAYISTSGELVAETHTGLPLWTVDNVIDGFVTGIVSSDDNTLYVYNDQKVIAVGSSGDELWSYTIRGDNFLQHVAADSNRVYLVADLGEVIALDLTGTEQWILPADSTDDVRSIEIGDDGTLYLRGYDSVTVLRP